MDVRFDMELAHDVVGQYEAAISSLTEHISSIRNTYEALRATSWSGEAEKSFLAEYGDVHAMWERVLQQLERTKQAIQTIKTNAEPIQEKSEQLM